MNDDINEQAFDALIDKAREKFRALLAQNPQLFGGEQNPRVAATLGETAPRGTIGVPAGIDTQSTAGLMAGIDLTHLVKNQPAEAETISKRAKDESAATVCVYPEDVARVQRVTGGNPPPIAVVGFPSVPNAEVETFAEPLIQTRMAVRAGAREIDMVLPFDFKDGNAHGDPLFYQKYFNYIRQVIQVANAAAETNAPIPVKVILETAYLTDEQKVEASMIAKMAGAAFVKTSTGFAEEHYMQAGAEKGATPHDVALMRRTVGDTTIDEGGREIAMGVKASGGVRTRERAVQMYEAGASRIGASGGIDVRAADERRSDTIEQKGKSAQGY